jgi:hypothetical protein
MILYHGTSTKHLEAIQRSGLQSRRLTKRRSNWKGSIRSKLGFVYLTDAYPVYFAMNSASGNGGKPSDILILKVEVDESQLYPDEDFIAWQLAPNRDDLSLRNLIAEIDPAGYQEHWRQSLEQNGTVCTPNVPTERILDYKVIDRKNYNLLMSICGDAMPIPINYQFMGKHYRGCIESLFEQDEAAALQEAASYWSLAAHAS